MNKFQHDTNRIICHYGTDDPVVIPDSKPITPVRALWVANVVNIDLPVIQGDGSDYKNHLRKVIETCIKFNLNTIYFHVRTTNDAFYQSKLNPYSRYLTGTEGTKPPFDIFAWLIEEAHKQQIEVHAWCNPYRISADGKLSIEDYLATCDDLNFAKRFPETIILDDKGKLILNPADPHVKQHIFDSMRELCETYDIDGIHFDDYFYPYGSLSDTHNDLAWFEKRDDKTESLDDFRRRQVNDVIEGVYNTVKQVDSTLAFGVSPFGIWKNKASDPEGSNTDPRCGESYFNQFADSVRWVQEGWLDYIVPQIYFPFGHPLAPFADLTDFWVGVVRNTDVALYIGFGAYRLGTQDDWLNPDELVDQMRYANQFNEVTGNVFFTYHNFIDNDKQQDGVERLRRYLNRM